MCISDTKDLELMGSTLSPTIITATNLVLTSILDAEERQEVPDDTSSDGSDGTPAPQIKATTVSVLMSSRAPF